MSPTYRTLTTSAFERDARSITRRNTRLLRVLDRLLNVLAEDPYNKSGRHDIKKLTGLKPGEGQWRIRRETTGCAMKSLAGMSYCTLFDTGERRINFLRKRYSSHV